MIKGIYLKKRPSMEDIPILDLMSNINFTKLIDKKEMVDSSGYDVTLNVFEGNKYKLRIYTSENKSGLSSIYFLFDVLKKASPNLVSIFKLDDKILLFYPNYKYLGENEDYLFEYTIEELLRITMISIKQVGDGNLIDSVSLVKDYIKTFIYFKED